MTTVVCWPCGRAATSVSQPASIKLMNASTPSGNGGACPDTVVSASPSRTQPSSGSMLSWASWSRFQSATSLSRWDCRPASNFAASTLGRVIRHVVESSPSILVILRFGSGLDSGSGRGSCLTAVRNWDTVATVTSSA